MPFYEYACAACGRHHEELQKVTDRPLRKCPHCGRPALKRLVSAPVFRLKGGGWYETDFKKDREAKRNLAGDKEPATAAGPPAEKPKDDKTEAKPAEATQVGTAKSEAPKPEAAKPSADRPAPARARRPALRRRKPRP